jgi:hypothetical protein
VIGVGGSSEPGSFVAGTGFTLRSQVSEAYLAGIALEDALVPSGTPLGMSMAQANNIYYGAVAAAFAASGTGSFPSPTPSPTGTPTPTPSPTHTPSPTGTPTPTPSPTATPSPTPAGSVRPIGVNGKVASRPWHWTTPNVGPICPDADGWWAGDGSGVSNWAGAGQPTGAGGGSAAGAIAAMQQEIATIGKLGAGVILREEFPWWLLEPSQGSYDWSRSDLIFAAAASAGVTLIPTIWGTPIWSSGNTTNAPSSLSHFGTFITAFMGRYGSRLKIVEFWNEPDGGNYWNSGVTALTTQILNPGYAAAKAAAPGVAVHCAPSYYHQDFFDAVYAASVAAGHAFPMDIPGYHDYVNSGTTYATDLHAWLVTKGLDRPVMCGEAGTDQGSATLTDQIHVTMIQGNAPAVLAGTSPQQYWVMYAFRDDGAYNCNGSVADPGKHYGMCLANGVTTKQSYSVMQALLG